MLEVFAYKRYKKHKLKKQTAKEALDKNDEAFIRKSLDQHSAPSTSTSPSMNPFIRIIHRKSTNKSHETEAVDVPPTAAELAALKVKGDSGTTTPTSQEEDLAHVLNSLNMAVSKKTAFSFSDETRAILKKFTQILKDIQSGGTHTYTDLTSLLESSNGHLSSLFDSTPSFLKSLISTIPFPLARKLDKKGPKEMAGDILKDLAKPGVITGLLKNIMNVLRTRFPAFVGSNALLSLGLFVLLIGVWYCYKRGKEERLKEEAASPAKGTTIPTGTPVAPEILVEGTHPQDDAEHGLGTHSGVRAGITGTTSPLHETILGEGMKPVIEDTDTPLQIESHVIPAQGPGSKKIKKSWLK